MKTIAQLSSKCGVHRTTLNKWVEKILEDNPNAPFIQHFGTLILIDETSPEFQTEFSGFKKGRPRNSDLPATRYYTRSVDDGNGRQNVTVVDNIIAKQELLGRSSRYTGEGNPEFIGQSVNVLRGKGFRKVRGPQVWNNGAEKWQSLSPDNMLPEED